MLTKDGWNEDIYFYRFRQFRGSAVYSSKDYSYLLAICNSPSECQISRVLSRDF